MAWERSDGWLTQQRIKREQKVRKRGSFSLKAKAQSAHQVIGLLRERMCASAPAFPVFSFLPRLCVNARRLKLVHTLSLGQKKGKDSRSHFLGIAPTTRRSLIDPRLLWGMPNEMMRPFFLYSRLSVLHCVDVGPRNKRKKEDAEDLSFSLPN